MAGVKGGSEWEGFGRRRGEGRREERDVWVLRLSLGVGGEKEWGCLRGRIGEDI